MSGEEWKSVDSLPQMYEQNTRCGERVVHVVYARRGRSGGLRERIERRRSGAWCRATRRAGVCERGRSGVGDGAIGEHMVGHYAQGTRRNGEGGLARGRTRLGAFYRVGMEI